jgi:hypothetical protein
VHRTGAAPARLIGDVDYPLDPRQVCGQRAAVDLAAPRRSCTSGIVAVFRGANHLLEIVKGQCQLVGASRSEAAEAIAP